MQKNYWLELKPKEKGERKTERDPKLSKQMIQGKLKHAHKVSCMINNNQQTLNAAITFNHVSRDFSPFPNFGA